MSNGNLPALPKPPAREMAGPTPWSNWVIPGRVIAGAYPASLDDAETNRILTTLLELGINTFVCLQAEVNINIPDMAWRSGQGLRPYIRDTQKILSKARDTCNPRITQSKVDFLHLPIIDGNITTDSALSKLATDCCDRVLRGERLYIHCWGGHGRTGTLVAVMLGRLYDIPYTTALRYTQAYHDTRVYPQGVRSPQTPVQRAQVRRILGNTGMAEESPIRALRSYDLSPSGVTPSTSLLAPARSSPLSKTTPLGGRSAALPSSSPARPNTAPRASVSAGRARPSTPSRDPANAARAGSPATRPPTSSGARYAGRDSGASVRGSLLLDAAARGGAGNVDRLAAELHRLRTPSALPAGGAAGLRNSSPSLNAYLQRPSSSALAR